MHGAQTKISNGNEEFKRFEEAVVKRHREEMKRELAKKLEEMDRTAAEELLKTGQYVDTSRRWRDGKGAKCRRRRRMEVG